MVRPCLTTVVTLIRGALISMTEPREPIDALHRAVRGMSAGPVGGVTEVADVVDVRHDLVPTSYLLRDDAVPRTRCHAACADSPKNALFPEH